MKEEEDLIIACITFDIYYKKITSKAYETAFLPSKNYSGGSTHNCS